MKLTPARLAALYTAVTTLAPFNKYKLPPAHKINFKVSRSKRLMGCYDRDCREHEITISSVLNTSISMVMETLCHEMTHLALEIRGEPDHGDHDSSWSAMATVVADELGYKFTTF